MMILIIGNSGHLYEAIRLAYSDHEIKMISWRGLAHEAFQSQADLLFIVGFDYGSYMKRYEDYIDVNVTQPMLAVRRFAKPTASIVYVATQNERRNFTFSRYRYAKEKLGQELMNQSTKAYVLRFDTFVTPNQEPLVKGGAITRLVFGALRKLGVVKTMDMRTVCERLSAYASHESHDVRDVTGVLLSIPRPQFIDRLMRLLFA